MKLLFLIVLLLSLAGCGSSDSNSSDKTTGKCSAILYSNGVDDSSFEIKSTFDSDGTIVFKDRTRVLNTRKVVGDEYSNFVKLIQEANSPNFSEVTLSNSYCSSSPTPCPINSLVLTTDGKQQKYIFYAPPLSVPPVINSIILAFYAPN